MITGKIGATALVFLLLTVRAVAATEPAKGAAIEELIEITGAAALGKQAMQQIMPDMWKLVKKANPQISDDMVSVMEEEFLRAFDETLPEFIAGTVAIYDRYYTAAEINELLAFYKTELGRKTISILPQLLGETMSFGRRWGNEVLAPLAVKRMKKRFHDEGYEL